MLTKLIFLIFLSFSPLFSEDVIPTPPSSMVLANPELESHNSFLEKSFPEKTKDVSYEHAFIKMILTLAGLIFLVFFTLWALRKLSNGKIGGFSSQKKIKILEKKIYKIMRIFF